MAACLTFDGQTLAVSASRVEAGRQAAEGIALIAADVLAQAGWGRAVAPPEGAALADSQPVEPDCVVVVVGPGSLPGVGRGWGVGGVGGWGAHAVVRGVRGGEAMARVLEAGRDCDSAPEGSGGGGGRARSGEGLAGWLVVTAARRGRVFVEDRSGVRAVAEGQLAPALLAGRWLIAGEARGALPLPGAVLSELTHPTAEQIAHAALQRLTGALPAREALPLYVDPPEAKLPADGLRATPV